MGKPLNISNRQRRLLSFIQNSINLQGRTPTHRDMQQFMGYKSPHSVQWHLDKLEDKGLIERVRETPHDKAYEIRVVGETLTDDEKTNLLAMKNRGVTLGTIAYEWSEL